MAKLKGPLFSLGAAGAIGKTLVYFGWKGIDVVREYVVPSNPKTTAQNTHRAYLTAAVAMVHTAQARAAQPLASDDQIAYSRLAQAKGLIMTWFNMAVKIWVDTKVAGDLGCIYSGGTQSDLSVDDFRPSLYLNEETASQLAAGKFFIGTSPTNMFTSKAADVNAGVDVGLDPANGFDGLTIGTKYYWQFRPNSGDPMEHADSGIYTAVATA